MPLDAAEAIRLLYPQQGDTVYRTIYGIVLDARQAQDLTRETFVRAYREWEPPEPTDARTWLLGIATSLAIASFGTRRSRWRVTALRGRWGGSGEEPVGGPSQDPDLVASLMRPLDPEERALVILHYCRQAPGAEIAEELGIPGSAVASRVNRAMRVLRRRAHAVGAAPRAGERGPLSEVPPNATDVAIIDALKHGLTRAAVSLPPVEEILNAADAPDLPPPVSILPLPPPGLISRSSRDSEKSLSRYLPYLVAVTVAAVLVGIVVGLNFYAASQDAPASARSQATPPSRTFHGGGGSATTPPTTTPSPVTPAPTPLPTPPPATPVPAATAAAPPPPPPAPVQAAPATPASQPAPAPTAAPPPPPPAPVHGHGNGHGHGPGPGGQG